MEQLTLDKALPLLETFTAIIIDNEVPFCELDSAAGDGDFGMSLSKGFREIKRQWAEVDKTDFGTLLKGCAMIILEHCGGASGPIWGSAFSGAAKSVKGKATLTLDEFAAMAKAAAEAIQKKGGAKRGDKTLLDALLPAVDSLEQSAKAGMGFKDALLAAASEAVAGGEATKAMVASRGRASYVGERSLSHPDAGAFALGVIFTGVAKTYS